MCICKIKLQFRNTKICPCFKYFLCTVPKGSVAVCPELHKKQVDPKHAKSGLFSLKYCVFTPCEARSDCE